MSGCLFAIISILRMVYALCALMLTLTGQMVRSAWDLVRFAFRREPR